MECKGGHFVEFKGIMQGHTAIKCFQLLWIFSRNGLTLYLQTMQHQEEVT